jgi:hypothetical protein
MIYEVTRESEGSHCFSFSLNKIMPDEYDFVLNKFNKIINDVMKKRGLRQRSSGQIFQKSYRIGELMHHKFLEFLSHRFGVLLFRVGGQC